MLNTFSDGVFVLRRDNLPAAECENKRRSKITRTIINYNSILFLFWFFCPLHAVAENCSLKFCF